MTTEERDKIIAVLKKCAFALESMAHLQGLELELLPHAEAARALIRELEPPPKEKSHCVSCGRSLDFQGYCVKCDGDIYED